MSDIMLVDGYNVINGWPELQALAKENLEHARDKLLSVLANYRGATGMQIILVFDAHGVKDVRERKEVINGIEVVFSRELETADSVIERLALSLRGNNVYVVTSDWEQQRVVFGSGAYRLSVRLFREEVLQMEKSIRTKQGSELAGRTLESRLSGDIRQRMEAWRRIK